MYAWNRQDWTRQAEAAHLDAIRAAPMDALPGFIRSYDWDLYPEAVLGWAMGQKGIDLDSAVAAFLNGTPERFNHIAKRDVPDPFLSAARMLDNICLRVNCGFYSAAGPATHADHARISAWMARQAHDRKAGTSGRWVLDEQIIAPLLGADAVQAGPMTSALSRRAPRRGGVSSWFKARLRARTEAPLTPGE